MARIIKGSIKHRDETQRGERALLSPPRNKMGRSVKFGMELGRYNSEDLTNFLPLHQRGGICGLTFSSKVCYRSAAAWEHNVSNL
jgi:hypothetical protein